jgi:type IV fimbrial biogenesis protein FimT
MKSQSGFTLIELMITLTVAGILMMVAVPSYREFIQSNRMTTQVNLLVATLKAARSEAIKRRKTVTVCKSSDQVSCASSGGWEQGWITVATDTPTPLFIQTGVPDLTIRGNTFVKNSITFLSSGYLKTMNNGTLVACDDRIKNFALDSQKIRSVIISVTGRIQSKVGPNNLTTCTPN